MRYILIVLLSLACTPAAPTTGCAGAVAAVRHWRPTPASEPLEDGIWRTVRGRTLLDGRSGVTHAQWQDGGAVEPGRCLVKAQVQIDGFPNALTWYYTPATGAVEPADGVARRYSQP